MNKPTPAIITSTPVPSSSCKQCDSTQHTIGATLMGLMLLEAADTVLGYYGFDRTAYFDPPKRNKKWWYQIIEERRRDVEDEIA